MPAVVTVIMFMNPRDGMRMLHVPSSSTGDSAVSFSLIFATASSSRGKGTPETERFNDS